ncbi:hypothetical protein [Desulfolithobacter dissulfuricans]|nr:hypothetical protein [Desulfolithobacter dissulfuricans]
MADKGNRSFTAERRNEGDVREPGVREVTMVVLLPGSGVLSLDHEAVLEVEVVYRGAVCGPQVLMADKGNRSFTAERRNEEGVRVPGVREVAMAV